MVTPQQAARNLLIKKLQEEERKVFALDYTGRNVQVLTENLPDTPAVQASWTEIPYKKESFDAVYSLGRNILHEYNTNRQNTLFTEANRVLKHGGKFLFDIPNRDKGHYLKLRTAHEKIMKSRGITHFREGVSYDSPNDVHYMTRYYFSEEDIAELAEENGFTIIEVKKTPINDGVDENIYFVLKKVAEATQAPAQKQEEQIVRLEPREQKELKKAA